MTTLSRRQFLQFMGLTGLSTQMRWLDTPSILQGRALGQVTIYRKPHVTADTLTVLWPDTVHRLDAHNAEWLKVGEGYAPITAFQPMLTAEPNATISAFPAWAEVIAPITAIRAYCAGDAPLRRRLEHGKVVTVLRSLQDDQGRNWLQVVDGWLQAEHVQAVPTIPHHTKVTQLRVGQGVLEVYAGQRRLLRAACRTPRTLPTCTHLVEKHPAARDGAPWQLIFEDIRLHGICHHHQFGPNATPCDDTCIELPLIVSRTLYPLIQNGAELVRLSPR